MTAALNVNLAFCALCIDGEHDPRNPPCPYAPVLIPCPVPLSVTFTVTLGECIDAGRRPGSPMPRACAPDGGGHHERCPARPIRVACSISGNTWEESEVDDVEVVDDPPSGAEWPTFDSARICTERWALVKALLGVGSWADAIHPHSASVRIGELRDQRDSVYAALADMARADSTIIQRFADIDRAYTNRRRDPFRGLAADEIAAYVEHLIEQVGVLS